MAENKLRGIATRHLYSVCITLGETDFDQIEAARAVLAGWNVTQEEAQAELARRETIPTHVADENFYSGC